MTKVGRLQKLVNEILSPARISKKEATALMARIEKGIDQVLGPSGRRSSNDLSRDKNNPKLAKG